MSRAIDDSDIPDLAEDLIQIQDCLDRGDVAEARALLATLIKTLLNALLS